MQCLQKRKIWPHLVQCRGGGKLVSISLYKGRREGGEEKLDVLECAPLMGAYNYLSRGAWQGDPICFTTAIADFSNFDRFVLGP